MSRLEELIHELCPDGVEYRSISDVSLHYTDGMHNLPKNIQDSGGYPILSAQNINDGIIDLNTTKYVSEETFNLENKRTNVKYGDVLLTIVGAIGRVAVVETDLKALFQRSVCVISPDPNQIISRYLKNILESSSIQNYIQANAHGAAQKGLYLEQVGKIKIPVPPLAVQHEIVRILDSFTELTAELTTELTTELTARKQQYEYYRKNLLNFDTNIWADQNLDWLTLEDVFEIRGGYTPSKNNPDFWENATVPWFRMEDIRENGHILSDSIQKINISAVKGKLFEANSIILSTSATIGEYALITVPSVANQRFTYFTLKAQYKKSVNIKFAFYYFFIISQWCKNNVNQGNFASVDMKRLTRFRFPIPKQIIQEKIVGILERFDNLCNDITVGLLAEIEARQKQYEYYRDKLLTFKEKKA